MQLNTDELDGFVLNWHGRYYAYRNQCPHTGLNLNWQKHRFFDHELQFLLCATHGALFEPESGLCVHGPCVNQSLPRLVLHQSEAGLFLDMNGL